MAETDSVRDEDTLFATFRWLLFEQFDDSTEDTLRQGFVFIGLATSFLAIVGATSAFIADARLYWVTLALGVLGITTLVFTWMIIQNQLEGLFVSGPEPGIPGEPVESAEKEDSVTGESDVDA
jgi:hypothetical protein